MKNLFLISVLSAFILPINGATGMEFDLPVPGSPGATAVAAAPAHVPFPELTAEQIAELNKTVQLTCNMISKLRQRFAEKDLTVSVEIPVSKLQKNISALIPLFERFFKINKNHFTPQNKALLKKFEKSIEMLSPASFVKGDSKSFEASIEMDRFPVVLETHNESMAYIPEWFIQSSFALYRKDKKVKVIAPGGRLKTQTTTGKHNLLHLLKGDNPESASGKIEYHHLRQTNEHFTPICFSYHKQSYKLLHKAKGKSLINRANCASDFYYTNKYVAGIQILRMVQTVFEYDEEVYGALIPFNTKEMINEILRSPGNIDVIPNPVGLAGDFTAEEDDDEAYNAYVDHLTSNADSDEEFLGASSDSRYSLDSATSDDSNSRDSVASSSSFVQQTRRVSVSTAATDGSLSDEASPIGRKKNRSQKRFFEKNAEINIFSYTRSSGY